MIKVRAEQEAILLWNRETGRTAYLSGEELEVLFHWATNHTETGFVERLKQMNLLYDDMSDEIISAISVAKSKKVPLRSFSAPESLHIELTEDCPLQCKQCYKSHSPAYLPFPFLQKMLQQANEMSMFQIALGGGEPLLYPNLNETIRIISQYGMSSSITTSGVGLTKNILQELIVSGLNHMQISLNGSNVEIHNLSRDGFKDGINALKLLAQTTISYGINWVARMDNIDDLEDLVLLAKEHHAQNINILRYKPSSTENYEEIYITDEKLRQLAIIIQRAKGISLKVDSAFSNLLCYLNQQAGLFSGCGAGRRFLALDAKGNFKPCSHVPFATPAEDLQSYWYSSKDLEPFRQLEDKIEEPCSSCKYLSGCRGCRAICMAEKGSFQAGEKGCIFRRAK